MHWITPILSILAIVSVAYAAPSFQDHSPTPLERKEKLLERLANKKIALAYSCGYVEGRMRLVDAPCLELRAVATQNGFVP